MKIGIVPAVRGVMRERAGEHAGLLAPFGLTFEVALRRARTRGTTPPPPTAARRCRRCRATRRMSVKLVAGHSVGHDVVDQRVLGREHHVGGAEQRVGTRREDLDARRPRAPRPGTRRWRRRCGRSSCAACSLIDSGQSSEVEVGEQAVGVRRDAQHPLLQRALEHRVVAAVAAAVGGDLFVGEHGAERGTPVDGRLLEVGEPVRVDDVAPRVVVELRPRVAVGIGVAHRLAGAGLELGDELRDRPGAVGVVVVPGVEDLEEDPLRPPVVRRRRWWRRPAAGRAPSPSARSWRRIVAMFASVVTRGAGRSGPRTARRAARMRRSPWRAGHCRPFMRMKRAYTSVPMYPSGWPTCRPAPLGYGNMSSTKSFWPSPTRVEPVAERPDRVGRPERVRRPPTGPATSTRSGWPGRRCSGSAAPRPSSRALTHRAERTCAGIVIRPDKGL